MPEQNELVSQISIKLDGSPVQENVMSQLAQAIIDQHSHLPGMFVLRFLDPGLELLDNGPFNLAKEVEITAKNTDNQDVILLKGEITALEPEFREGMIAELGIRGYDKSHRLFRETKSTAYVEIKDSDIASQIAGHAGLTPEVDTTSTVYKHIYQDNQTDLEFLMERAWRIGYECFVAGGKLHFRKPPTSGNAIRLTWGDDLLSFRPRMTLAEQVSEVVVKGWDYENKKAITGRSSRGALYPRLGESRNGAQWAQGFGTGTLVIVDQPVVSQAEADALAKARLDEISGAFVDAEGEAFRKPEITAGKFVELQALGNRFSGTYLVTSATHVFSPEGLKTTFSVRGTRTGLVSEQMSHQAPVERWTGVVPAIVTDVDDPEKLGRVKVKYPWMSDNVASHWARVMGIGAGNQAGFCVIPNIDDEVLVSFVHGDINQPVVLGGLWNGVDKLPPEVDSASGGKQPFVRTWHSIKGHIIAVYDTDDNKIEIKTIDGRSITLDDKNKKIIIKTQQSTVTLEDSKLTIETASDINLKASANLKLEASGNIEIKAGAQLKLQGSVVNIN